MSSIPSTLRRFHSKTVRAILLFNPGLGQYILDELQEIINNPWFPEKLNTKKVVIELFPERIRIDNIYLQSILSIVYRSTTIKDAYLFLGRLNLDTFIQNPETLKNGIEDSIPGSTDSSYWEINCIIRKNSITQEEIISKVSPQLKSHSELEKPPIRLLIYIRDNILEYYIGFRNSPNYRRGFRVEMPNSSPISEDISSILIRELINLTKPALDKKLYYIPFSGTGTFGWESILQEFKIQPSIWSKEVPELAKLLHWGNAHNYCLNKSLLHIKNISNNTNLKIVMSDWHQSAIQVANDNLRELVSTSIPELNFVYEILNIKQADYFQEIPKEALEPNQMVYMPIHPPYGIRTGRKENSYSFYRRISIQILEIRKYIHVSSKLSGFILTPDKDGMRAILTILGKDFFTKIINFSQGKLSVRAVFFW